MNSRPTAERLKLADPRRTGAIVGLAIAAAILAPGFQVLLAHQRLEPMVLFLTQGIPTLLAGLVGGWLLAPRAASASTRRDWLGIVLGLGVVAVLLGAFTVGIALAFESALRLGSDPGQILTIGILGGLMAALIGLLLLGWLILPVTILAAAIWALVMCRLLPRTPARSP